MNKVELTGFAGMDPEFKTIGEHGKMAKFSLATSEGYKKDGQWVNITQWHYLVGWNKIADKITELVKKGKKVTVSGKLNYRTYEDKEGKTQRDTQIVVYKVEEAPLEK
ncbi:MAG TPA: single-stranded DNA-binding protein [Flavobacteriales bacterium]|nr:single-stranded DNA-binding protein [Flavobacteriales bacterium]